HRAQPWRGGEPVSAEDIEDLYALSPLQQGLLFHTLLGGPALYVDQQTCEISVALDATAFSEAWRQVIERHTALRTAFLYEDLGHPVQIVFRRVDVPLTSHDWRGRPAAAQRDAL